VGDIEETQGVGLNYPSLPDQKVSDPTTIHPNANNNFNSSPVFIIDQQETTSDLHLPASGRNFDEILLLIDSLQLTSVPQTGQEIRLRTCR